MKYALRLVNRGGRTTNGDGGQSSVKGPDGTNFIFSACSLCVNGTNHIRGQLPQILYYRCVYRKQSQTKKTSLQYTNSLEFKVIIRDVTHAYFFLSE